MNCTFQRLFCRPNYKQDCLSVKGLPPTNAYLYVVVLIWPWPWPGDLDTWLWPRCCEDVSAYEKWSFWI